MNPFNLSNIETDVEEFVKKILLKNKNTNKLYQTINIVLNMLTIFGSFILVIITTLIISKLLYNKSPNWYYYLSSGIPAGTTFISLILNLFVVKKRITETRNIHQRIEAELAFYSSSKGIYSQLNKNSKEFLLFKKVTQILKYKMALYEEEVGEIGS